MLESSSRCNAMKSVHGDGDDEGDDGAPMIGPIGEKARAHRMHATNEVVRTANAAIDETFCTMV
jgi:hypothetical protein